MNEDENYIKDMDIFRLYNKSFNYYIASQEKNINFFTTSHKKISYINPKLNYETNTFISYLEESGNENLQLHLEVKKEGSKNSILTLFEIIKLGLTDEEIAEVDELGNLNIKLTKKLSKKFKKLNDVNVQSHAGNQDTAIYQSEPILIRNIVNGMFLCIKIEEKKQVILGELGDSSSEFIFILENKDKDVNGRISYNNPIKIKSISGGVISLRENEQYYIDFQSSESGEDDTNIETNNEELEIESKLHN